MPPPDPRPARRRAPTAAAAAAVIVLCGTVGLAGGFARFVSGIDRVEHEPPASADGIVALTGGQQRIGDAVDLLARGYGQRLLITGVNERTTRDEIVRLNPAQRSLLDCCVDLDYRARNTVGNATEARRWTRRNGFRSLIVVTSNYHMARALTEFDHALPEISKLPHPVVTSGVDAGRWWSRVATARLLVGEYAKYLGAVMRTRLSRAEGSDPAPVSHRLSGR